MCGRYYTRRQKQEIAERMRAKKIFEEPYAPNFNIAPTTYQPVLRLDRDTGERELALMRWGLVPFFAKSLADFKGFSTFNARAETLMKSPTWREPLKKRRSLGYGDGFYEWKKLDDSPKPAKQPFAITSADGEPFFFACLWDAWKDPATGLWLQSYAIITVEANEIMSPIHNRMPGIIRARDQKEWLDRDDSRPPPLHLLRPYDSELMQVAPCNPAVGNVRNNGPEMLVCPMPGTLPLNSA
jgi:putative SOS response-associated peptidase YedK